MGFEMDAEESAEDVKKNMYALVSEGKHHFIVINAEEFNDYAEVKFEVTAGPDQGREIKERFYFRGADAEKTAICKKRILKACFALKYLDESEYEQARAEGRSIKIEFEDWQDRHCVGEVKHREYEAKDGTKKKAANIGFGFFAIDDKEAKGVILDPELVPNPPVFADDEPATTTKAAGKSTAGNAGKTTTTSKRSGSKPTPVGAGAGSSNGTNGKSSPASYDDV